MLILKNSHRLIISSVNISIRRTKNRASNKNHIFGLLKKLVVSLEECALMTAKHESLK